MVLKIQNLTLASIYIWEIVTFVIKNSALFNKAQQPQHNFNLHSKNNFPIPKHRTSFSENQLFISGMRLFNTLPAALKDSINESCFRVKLKHILQKEASYNVSEFVNFKY